MFDTEKAWMINPRKTRTTRRGSRRKGKVTMARKRKQPAALAKYWAGKRRKKTARKRRKSSLGYSRKTRKAMGGYGANPPKRRRARRNRPVSHRRRSYRRNPGFGGLIPSTGFLKEIAFVGAGYYGTRVAYNFVGPMVGIGGDLPRIAIKGLVAFAVSYLGGMLLGSSARNSLLLGGAVEVMQDAVKTYVSPFVPLLASADMQDVSAYFQPSVGDDEVGAYYQGTMGASIPSDNYAE
jgi:hypothetical protein